MNLVGKILTGIITFFSIIFMTLVLAVYATHNNWKVAATDLGKDLAKMTEENEKLLNEKKSLKEEYDKEKQQLNDKLRALATDVEQKTTDIEAKQKECDNLQKQQREAVAALESTQKNTTDLRQEVDTLRKTISKVREEHASKFAEAVKKNDELLQARNQNESLTTQKTAVENELQRARDVLTRFNLKPQPELYTGEPPWPLHGRVMAASDRGSVELSLGSDDGLRVGHKLEVYRVTANDSVYLGRVEVIETKTDRAVGRMIRDYQKGIVQKGDHVASKLIGVTASN